MTDLDRSAQGFAGHEVGGSDEEHGAVGGQASGFQRVSKLFKKKKKKGKGGNMAESADPPQPSALTSALQDYDTDSDQQVFPDEEIVASSSGKKSSMRVKMPKLKGLFSRNSREVPDAGYAMDDGAPPDYNGPPPPTRPVARSSRAHQSMNRLRDSFRGFLRTPPAARVYSTLPADTERVQLNELPPESNWSMDNALNVILVLCIVTGIILTACGSLNQDAKVLGPCFLGLGCFALVGKIVFTAMWIEHPVNAHVRMFLDKIVGGVKDPYGLNRTAAPPPASSTGGGYMKVPSSPAPRDMVPMNQLGYATYAAVPPSPLVQYQPQSMETSKHNISYEVDRSAEPAGRSTPQF